VLVRFDPFVIAVWKAKWISDKFGYSPTRRAVGAVQTTIALLNSSADNEPTKDWIRISVSALDGKVERQHNQLSVMVPCDN
jgi:hypothetical protein